MKKHAEMNCCSSTAKTLLVVFNCIFWACGIAILGVGIWIKTDPELSNLGQAIKVGVQEPIVEIITWLFIGAGIFVFAVGVVGMIGIMRESKIMMGFYLVCIFIVFAAEAGAGVYAGVRKDFIKEQLRKGGAQYIKDYYTRDVESLVSKGFNYVQAKYKCCGVNDFMDYKGSEYLKELGGRIKANASMSFACCSTQNDLEDAFQNDGLLVVGADERELCMSESVQATSDYQSPIYGPDYVAEQCENYENYKAFHCTKGCIETLEDWTEENLIIMLAIGVAIGASQLILLFLALWFIQSLGE